MAAVMMAYPSGDNFPGFTQQYAMYQTRAHQPHTDIAEALKVNPYARYGPVSDTPQYVNTSTRSTHYVDAHQQSSSDSQTTMAEDGTRPSLPSISNLLDIANRPQIEANMQHAQLQAQQSNSVALDHRSSMSYPAQEYSSSQRTAIPPTPPLRNDSVLDGTHSPSTISTGSSLSMPQAYYMGSSLNNVEAAEQRTLAAQRFLKRHSLPSQPNISPYGGYSGASPYNQSPGTVSNGSYCSPTDTSAIYAPGQHHHHQQQAQQPQQPQQPAGGLYHQRPLPSNFPPPPPPQQALPSPPRILEHHHHHINPSSASHFPQNQDRYICQTCNKAFSRPSSLKIHSHSHSGEKPFRCPHAGCGKSFSVRSNMKRHERGCHGGPGGI